MSHDRVTSIEAYRAIQDSGLINALERSIYNCLYDFGPLTTREIYARIARETLARDVGVVSSRLSAMRNKDVVKEVGETHCVTTGRLVIQWDVTANVPCKVLNKTDQLECPTCKGKGYIAQGRLF